MKNRFFVIVLIIILSYALCVKAENADNKVEEAYKTVCEEKGSGFDTYVTRGEFLSLLMESMGYTKDVYVCSFNDVYDMSWQYIYIANAESRSVAFGCYDGHFFPNRLITAEEAITFISRAYKITSNDEETGIGLKMSDYSKKYMIYAVINNVYPKRNNNLVPAESYLSAEECKALIKSYMGLDERRLREMDFLYGYPKAVESGSSEYISIAVKCSKPCKVYYEIKEADKVNSVYIPNAEALDKLMGEVPYEDYEIRLSIKADRNVRYNIYMAAVDEYGNRGRVYTVKNISPLPFTQGNGTAENPYRIYTSYQLNQIRYYPDKCFLLCNDIEYNASWEPIGNPDEQETLFSGCFDGGGYSITGLKISGKNKIGIFSRLFGATVRNLSAEADVNGANYVGIIAGESEGGIIENCHAAGNVTASENISGGIVGKNNGIIRNCLTACYNVSALSYSGGIAGTNSGDILNCLSCVTYIYSDMYASGISGINTGGTISSCAAASREVTDTLTKNSGRITTNREGGKTKNNYAYEEMVSGSTAYIGADMQDGAEVSWADLTGQTFYVNRLKWDFRNVWTVKSNADFIMPVVRNVNEPKLIPGVTVYMPYPVYTEEELRSIEKNKQYHYVLKNDIILSDRGVGNVNWTPIGIAYDEERYVEDAFCGTFDGNGHSVKNIRMVFDDDISQYGFFGTLYGATVRNLKLENINIEGHSSIGAVAAINYGIIENCSVSGKINAYSYNKETMTGGISAVNYTNIYSCDVKTDISINAVSSNVGGIAAYNEGFIKDCMFDANMESVSNKDAANSILGNIVGINYSGYVYECFGRSRMSSSTDISYCGGIIGMHDGGEIYKCSSSGTIYVKASSQRQTSSYCGGIAGIISGGLIMNSFTADNVGVISHDSYAGGISGYCENANIQNVYAVNSINQQGGIIKSEEANIYAGGITGYNDNGNISGSVSLNAYIMTNGRLGMIAAFSEGGYVDNNYYLKDIYTNTKTGDTSENGSVIIRDTAENIDFYFTSIEKGGFLGWANSKNENVWKESSGNLYPYPVLSGVKNQSVFNNIINN